MQLSQHLQPITETEAVALASCWGVSAQDVIDTRRSSWVQATSPGDATGPRLVQFRDRTLAVYPHPGEPNQAWAPRFLAVRAFADTATAPMPERATARLHSTDAPLVVDLHERCSRADLAAATPHLGQETILARGVIIDHRLVAMCTLVPTCAGPPEVSVLACPSSGGRGYATAAERAVLVDAARHGISTVQHRTIAQDHASISLALRSGFRILTLEHIVQPASTTDR